jgi:hypothetical protein
LPFTGLDVPDAEGVPWGAQSRPQPLLDDVVVEVEVVDTAAPPVAEEELVVVVLDVDVGVVELEIVEVMVPGVVVDEVELVEVSEPVPAPGAVVCPLPALPQPAATPTTTSAATIRDTKRIGVDRSVFTAGPRALRARV